jgi:hypothetical protein
MLKKFKEMSMPAKIVTSLCLLSLPISFYCILFTGCSALKHYPEDNIVEEWAEEIIKNETGLDIDLSPWSPETT